MRYEYNIEQTGFSQLMTLLPRRRFCVRLFSIIALLSIAALSGHVSAADLEGFLKSRPAFVEIQFRCLAHNHNSAVEGEFLVRWQQDALRVQRVVESSTTSEGARGRYADYHWYFDPSGTQLFESHSTLSPQDQHSNAYQNYVWCLRAISPLLNLGVYNVDPSKIQWNGPTLEGIDLNNRPLTGTLVLSNRQPVALDYVVNEQAKQFRWRVLYTFDMPEMDFPSKIAIYFVNSTGAMEFDREYYVSSFAASATPAPQKLFVPERTRDDNVTLFTETSNGLFIRNKEGKLVPAQIQTRPEMPVDPSAVGFVRASLAAFFVLSGVFLTIASLRQRSATHPTKGN